jgi:hypothetical protein
MPCLAARLMQKVIMDSLLCSAAIQRGLSDTNKSAWREHSGIAKAKPAAKFLVQDNSFAWMYVIFRGYGLQSDD